MIRVNEGVGRLLHAIVLKSIAGIEVHPIRLRGITAAGRFADAEKSFEDDMQKFPENVWALRGLAESLTRQQKTAAAAEVQRRIQRALEGTAIKHVH